MIHKHTISFVHALRGARYALMTQPNYRVHACCSILALAAGFFLHITKFEFLIIIFLITMGFSIETINTAIEQTNDAITEDRRDAIRIAKDVSAGAMLIFAFGSVILAILIFYPYLLNFFIKAGS